MRLQTDVAAAALAVGLTDPARRAALFDALHRLGAQVWMTGADPAAFTDIASRAEIFDVRTISGTPVRSP